MKASVIVVVFSAAIVGIGIAVHHMGNRETPKPPLVVASPPPITAQAEPAPITPAERPPNVQFAEQVAGRIVAYLRNMQLPYVADDDFVALRAKFAATIAEYASENITAQQKEEIFAAVDQYIVNNFHVREDYGYLIFPDRVETLQWKLMLALKYKALTPDDLRRQEEQREWMRAFIRSIPEPEERLRARNLPPGSMHEAALASLESKFDDPFSALANLVLTDEGFSALKRRLESQSGFAMEPSVVTDASLRFAVEYRIKFDPFPNDPGEADSGENISFKSNAGFKGVFYQLADGGFVAGVPSHFLSLAMQENGNYYNSGHMTTPAGGTPAQAEEALSKSMADLYLDQPAGRLVGLRGAKLTRLNVQDWMAADDVTKQELEAIIRTNGAEAASVAEFIASPFPSHDPPPVFVALLNHENRIAVLKIERFLNALWLRVRIRPD